MTDNPSGTTRKGVRWYNQVANKHWMNCMQSVRERALPHLSGDNGVDLCCGFEKVKDGCWGIDCGEQFGPQTDADDLRDASDLTGYADGRFDWVFSSNGLEHIVEWEKALAEWVRVLKSGGVVFLYLPWPEKEPLWATENDKHTGAKHHQWNPAPDIVRDALTALGVNVYYCEEDSDEWGAFAIAGVK